MFRFVVLISFLMLQSSCNYKNQSTTESTSAGVQGQLAYVNNSEDIKYKDEFFCTSLKMDLKSEELFDRYCGDNKNWNAKSVCDDLLENRGHYMAAYAEYCWKRSGNTRVEYTEGYHTFTKRYDELLIDEKNSKNLRFNGESFCEHLLINDKSKPYARYCGYNTQWNTSSLCKDLRGSDFKLYCEN